MSGQQSCSVPRKITQGDTVSLSFTFPLYPASEWSLNFCLAKDGVAIAPIEAKPDGDSFNVDISTTTSGSFTPGVNFYSLVAKKQDSQSRVTVQNGEIFIAPDPTASIVPSENQKILSGLKAGLLKVSSGTNLSIKFNGQEFTKRNLKELQDIIDRYTVIVQNELRELGLTRKGGAQSIVTRFYQ